MPAIFEEHWFVEVGGLMSCAPDRKIAIPQPVMLRAGEVIP
jgi:hypothetical protein